jgi:hypothetical protein
LNSHIIERTTKYLISRSFRNQNRSRQLNFPTSQLHAVDDVEGTRTQRSKVQMIEMIHKRPGLFVTTKEILSLFYTLFISTLGTFPPHIHPSHRTHSCTKNASKRQIRSPLCQEDWYTLPESDVPTPIRLLQIHPPRSRH